MYEPVDGTPTSDPGAIGTLLDMGSAIAAGEDPGDLGAVVDIDGWLRNIALDMVIPDYDGMWGNHKNHLIYDHPDRGLLLVGYDKDLAFVGLGSYFYGRCEGSIWGAHPCWSRRRAPPAVAGELLRREPERYVELVEELLAGAFDPDALIAWLQARRDAIRPWVTADRYYQPLGPACDRDPTWCQWYTPGAWEWDAGPALETDIRTRWDQVRAQLDGDFPCAESCDEGPHAGLDDGDD